MLPENLFVSRCIVHQGGIPTSFNFGVEVQRGNILGFHGIHKFCKKYSVGATQEDVWEQSGNYTYLESVQSCEILSNNIVDNLSGIGARHIHILGLDGDCELISESKEIKGIEPVSLDNKYYRFYRMHIEDAGSSGGNVGDIICRTVGTEILQAKIVAPISGEFPINQTQMSMFTIPCEMAGMVFNFCANVPKAKDANARLFRRPFGGVFQLQSELQIYQQGEHKLFYVPVIYDEKTDIKIVGSGGAGGGNVNITCTYDVVLLEKKHMKSFPNTFN